MTSEIISYDIPTDQIASPASVSEDFSTKLQQELLAKYNLPTGDTITDLPQVIQLLSDPAFEDQSVDIFSELSSFPFKDKENLNILYSTLKNNLSDPSNFETFEIDPTNYIINILGDIKTKIEQEKLEKEEEQVKQQQIEKKNEINKQFLGIYNETQTDRNTLAKKFDTKITLASLNPSHLKVFQDAFESELIAKTGKITPNDKKNIDAKILSFIRYQAYLQRQKPEQLTVNQKSQKEKFSSFLVANQIDSDDFFGGFVIEKRESNNKAKSLVEPEAKPQETKTSPSEEKGLGNLSASFEQINTQNMKVSPIFTDELGNAKSGFERKSLIDNFPLPNGVSLADFKFENGNIGEFITQLQLNGLEHPLIQSSTSDPESLQKANKSLIVYLLYKANPTQKQIPDSIANILYPSKSGNKSWINKISRDKQMNYIEDKLLVPLMKNNFCSTNTEQFLGQEIKKGYMGYLSKLMEKTPSLEAFKINPQETEFSNEKTRIPLHLDNPNQVSGYLTIENGKIYLTNSLYNPHDPDHANQISTGKVYIGDMMSFDDFTKNISNSITDTTMKSALTEKNPYESYHTIIKDTITEDIATGVKKIDATSANISHGLSGTKVQDSIFDLMKTWPADGTTPIDQTKPILQNNPFYPALRDYKLGTDKTISKKDFPDTFESLSLIRTTMLGNSARENKRLEDSLHQLQGLISSPVFNKNLDHYLDNLKQQGYETLPPNDQKKYMILQTLSSESRKDGASLSLFLQLFGTNPQQPQHNSLNLPVLDNTIQQLATQGDLGIVSFMNIPNQHHTFAKLENKYAPSADTMLDKALSNIDTNKKEIWK